MRVKREDSVSEEDLKSTSSSRSESNYTRHNKEVNSSSIIGRLLKHNNLFIIVIEGRI